MSNEFDIHVLLLVEDSDDDIIITQRKIYRSSLKIGECIVVKTLQECLNTAKNKEIDVILLDLNLPETQGLDTLLAVRKLYEGIVIVLTSIDDEMVGVEAIRKGADDYIVKNALTEYLLTKSVVYARERRKAKQQAAVIQQKLEVLSNLG
jgi:DNA-binding response OmpR family regulator